MAIITSAVVPFDSNASTMEYDNALSVELLNSYTVADIRMEDTVYICTDKFVVDIPQVGIYTNYIDVGILEDENNPLTSGENNNGSINNL